MDGNGNLDVDGNGNGNLDVGVNADVGVGVGVDVDVDVTALTSSSASHRHGVPVHDAFAGRPPIPLICVSSMALVLVSGIYLAAYLPRRAPLGPAAGLVAAAGAVLVLAVVLVSRMKEFAWDSFFVVVKWASLAYLVIAGILEYVFVYDGTRGAMLVLLTISLFVFAVDIPVLLGFSVARFQVRQTPG